MKQYHYFVSYQYKKSKDYGFGQVNLLLKETITRPEQVEEIRDHIQERYKFKGVVIINFLLLREEEVNM